MLRISQIRLLKFWLIWALATAFIVTWYYLSTTRPAWAKGRPEVVFAGYNADIASPTSAATKASSTLRNTSHPALLQNTTYTQTLVVAKLQEEDVSWVDDLVHELPHLTSAVYTVDNANASLTVPMNKGHEAMVYLTYIIDHYSQLSDVTLFMHSHQITWHNNDFLGSNSSSMVRRLRIEHVVRNGYMNLRCHLEPGCPDHIHPISDEGGGDISNIPEAAIFGSAWKELFPNHTVPEVLSQPCCSQFAVSAEYIRRISLDEYVSYRDWILGTALEDRLSGRVWEYIWQWMFTGQPEYCPEEVICYCQGYGICFNPNDYNEYFRLRNEAAQVLKEIDKLETDDAVDVQEDKVSTMKAEVARLHQKMEKIKAANAV